MTTPEERIELALSFAPAGSYDGGHHKMWVIDQMVRALTGCPSLNDYELGESDEYHQFRDAVGGWDEGIAP
jgi:hypothetical protein